MPARRHLRRLLAGAATVALAVALLPPAALAVSPYGGSGSTPADPYRYQDYMRLGTYTPPSEFGDKGSGGDAWKYSSKSACGLYGEGDPHCTPRTKANELDGQELNNVTGASVDKAWEVTTGRPDVVIGVVDSGIKWNDVGAMRDLNNKVYLNVGELPEPDWGVRDPAHPYDRDRNGQVDMRDYCPVWDQPATCGGTGDSRVVGRDLNANGLIDPEDLIFLFSDGADTDGDGYADNIAGWDTYEDDNDPFDEHQYGHGTGEARDSTAEANNGGDVGTCPDCRIMPLRVGDSFIADVNDFAQAVLFATDTGATLIQSALGTLNNSRFAQEAIDYAYRRGVVLIASAADESAGHHNQPSVLEHAVTFNAVGEPQTRGAPSASGSYLQFRGCTNFGAYITAAVPGNSCSSEAVGRASGMAGLVYAAGKNQVARERIADYGVLDGPGGVPAGQALSAEEVKQLVVSGADDINNLTPVNKENDVDFPGSQRYPASEGWDPFFGYGRINANTMVRAVEAGRIPPEADISSPKWFAIRPTSAPIRVEGSVAARRAASYGVTLQWAVWSWRDANSAPAYKSTGVTMSMGPSNRPQSGLIGTIDPAEVKKALDEADTAAPKMSKGTVGPAVDPATGRGDHENRNIPDKFGVLLRLVVTAKDAAGKDLTTTSGAPLQGVSIKNMNLHDDPALVSGFPKDLGGDGAAPPRFADLDDDGVDELVVATSDGIVHAYRADGTELPGWPVRTTPMPSAESGSAAYRSGEITLPLSSAVLRSPAIGDLDRDGSLEVVVPDFAGRISAFHGDGSPVAGFPVRTDPAYSAPQPDDRRAGYYRNHPAAVPGLYPRRPEALPNDPDLVPDLVNRRTKNNRTHWWLMGAPTLADIDPAVPGLEVVAGAADRHVYAWHADGTPVRGWPVLLRDPAKVATVDPFTHEITQPSGVTVYNGAKIVTSPAVGDLDGDGVPEVVAAPNEQYKETPNSTDPVFAATAGLLTPGNDRLYAVYPDGARHGAGPGSPANGFPNANAFLPGWPAKISTLALETLPVVGDGPTGSPVIGDVDGDGTLDIAEFGTAGPVHVLDKSGRSIYGTDSNGRDITLDTERVGPDSNSSDKPSIPGLGGGIFTGLRNPAKPDYAVPAVGLGKLTDLLLPDDQLNSDNHLAVFDPAKAGTRSQLPAFPREVNDLQFLSTPSSADIDGVAGDELMTGTAYSDLHAFKPDGSEPGSAALAPDGWPKFTGGWTVVAPAVGSFTGRGTREVASTTREGNLFVWRTPATECSSATWREWGHDGWNSGNTTTDAIRPARVADLAVSTGGQVTFTAVGDDGRCGQAATYDLRASSEPITPGNFASATPLPAPRPKAPGGAESFAVTLPVGTRYVALRVYDADPATARPVAPANPSALAVTTVGLAPTPAPTPTPTSTPTSTASPTATGTPTPTPTGSGPTGGPTGGPTAGPTASRSPAATPTGTPTAGPTASRSPAATAGASPPAGGGAQQGERYHAVTPARLLDTRSDGGPVRQGSERTVQVTGRAGVPASGVTAVVLNVTVTGVTRSLDLLVRAAGRSGDRRTSNLNAVRGQTVANLVTTRLDEAGRIGLTVSQGQTQVVVDVLGWYGGPGGDGYTALRPQRVLDTRRGQVMRAGAERVVPLLGDRAPTGVSAAVVSVTATGASAATHVELWAAGDRPANPTSTLNLRRGDTVANLAVVPVDAQGRAVMRVSSGTVHVILDVLGYFSPDGAGRFVPVEPARTYDTRENNTRLLAGEGRAVTVAGLGGVPERGVSAVLVNVTSVGSSAPADLQVYPVGDPPPGPTSNLNVRRGQTVPVLVLMKVGQDGKVVLKTSQGSMHIVFDVVGWMTG